MVISFKMTILVEQWVCTKFCIKLEHSSTEAIWMIQKATAMGNCFITTTCPLMHHVSCRVLAKHQITQVTKPRYSSDLVPYDFWLFSKLKSPLKGNRFRIVAESQENMLGQLMVIGRTVWGSKVPTLKGTQVALSYIQCFLYPISSSINVSIFHITWLDTL